MYEWIKELWINNWNDLLLIGVGLSAFIIYFMQKNAEKKVAATLILGQIDAIDKTILALKNDGELGNVSIYKTNPILRENMWEKYKHLFVKNLSSSEYELLQKYYERAEQLERTRNNIINTMYSAWSDKSSVEHQIIGNIIHANYLNKKSIEDTNAEISSFQETFRKLDIVFTPDITINTLLNNLNNFNLLSGTTAYQKIQKKSYIK